MGEPITSTDDHNDHDQTNFGGHFAVVPMWLLDAIGGNQAANTALRVYVTLQRWADYRTHECWPSQTTIADTCGMAGTATKNAIRLLQQVGALVVNVERHAHGRRNRYRLVFDPPRDPETPRRRTRKGSGVQPSLTSDAEASGNEDSCERTRATQDCTATSATDLNGSPSCDERTPGQRAHAVMTAYWQWVERETGHKPASITAVGLVRLLTPFFAAGRDEHAIKTAMRAMYEDGTTLTRAALERYLDGRAGRRGRRSSIVAAAAMSFDANGNLIDS